MNEWSFVIAIAAFVAGWIGNEAYQHYKNCKEKRWH